MQTLLHTVNSDTFCGIVEKTTDFTRLCILVKAIPERDKLIASCVRSIESNTDPVTFPFKWDTIFAFPRIERVDLPLLVTLDQFGLYAFHPELRRFRVSIIVEQGVRDRDTEAYLKFLINFMTGEYDFQGRRIRNNRDFQGAFISVGILGVPQIIVTGKQLYASPRQVDRITDISSGFEMWYDFTTLRLYPSPISHIIIDFREFILEVGPDANLDELVSENVGAFFDDIVVPENKNLDFYYVASSETQNIGDVYIFFWEFLTRFTREMLNRSTELSRLESISFPASGDVDLDDFVSHFPQMPYYVFVVNDISQVRPVETQKRATFYRAPDSDVISNLPVYPIYRSVEECMLAYTRN